MATKRQSVYGYLKIKIAFQAPYSMGPKLDWQGQYSVSVPLEIVDGRCKPPKGGTMKHVIDALRAIARCLEEGSTNSIVTNRAQGSLREKNNLVASFEHYGQPSLAET